MLETVREFAKAKSGDIESELGLRHARYFAGLFRPAHAGGLDEIEPSKTLQWARVHAPTEAKALGAAVARCRRRGTCDNPGPKKTVSKAHKLSARRARPHSF